MLLSCLRDQRDGVRHSAHRRIEDLLFDLGMNLELGGDAVDQVISRLPGSL